MQPAIDMNREQFSAFCQLNRDVRIERSPEGSVTVMAPTGGETGARGAFLLAALHRWAEKDGTGVAFDSSTGFELPNGAVRSPDAAWVLRTRLARTSCRGQGGIPAAVSRLHHRAALAVRFSVLPFNERWRSTGPTAPAWAG